MPMLKTHSETENPEALRPSGTIAQFAWHRYSLLILTPRMQRMAENSALGPGAG